MPLYVYICSLHGEFETIQTLDSNIAFCPDCGEKSTKQVTTPARITVTGTQRLPYGNGSRGRFISREETGGMDILVPSWGAMEKEEVDYVAEAAVEKEKERVRKRQRRESMTKKRLGAYLDLAYQTKPGQRANALREAMKQGQRHI